jgi:gluconate 2-dehydrogenase alpha chain
MSVEKLKPVDVVVVGLGAAGGTAVYPLAKAGLKVVGLEAGPRVDPRDFPFDEIRNDIRDHMGRWKSNREVPTTRPNSSVPATRPLGATGPMMNAVGGTSIHWMTQSWRYLPWNFKVRSETIRRYGAGAIPANSTVQDWPLDYHELEPYYDKIEYTNGVSGQAGNIKGNIDGRGNIFEGPRRRKYPNPPLRPSGWTELTANAARTLDWHPYRGPAGIRSKPWNGLPECTYCGFCGWTGCYRDAKAQTNLHYIPMAEKTGNLKVVPLARVTKIGVDSNGRVSGVTYIKNHRAYFQPAKFVVIAGYTYENVRTLLLSPSKAFPNGLSNNHGQVGKHYIAHGLGAAGATAWFHGHRLNRFSGTIGQFTAIDDWDADNFDHGGLGFIGGGMCSATMEAKPIGTANTLPPGVPRWGSAYKAWLKDNADSIGSVSAQLEVLSYEQNYLDLDPTTKDDLGRPVLRITFDITDNEKRCALFVIDKLKQWAMAAGATQVWAFPPSGRPLNTHAFGGTRSGNDPAQNVVDRWGVSHEVPNLALVGGSTFPTSAGRNPTETIQAMAYRTAKHITKSWKSLTT